MHKKSKSSKNLLDNNKHSNVKGFYQFNYYFFDKKRCKKIQIGCIIINMLKEGWI